MGWLIAALVVVIVLAVWDGLAWRVRAENLAEENTELGYRLGRPQGCQHDHLHSLDCPGVTVGQLRDQLPETGKVVLNFQSIGDFTPVIPKQRRGGEPL